MNGVLCTLFYAPSLAVAIGEGNAPGGQLEAVFRARAQTFGQILGGQVVKELGDKRERVEQKDARGLAGGSGGRSSQPRASEKRRASSRSSEKRKNSPFEKRMAGLLQSSPRPRYSHRPSPK